jgi:hypothetical protein
VNAKDFETSRLVWDADVDLTVKASKATQSGIDRIRAIGGGHDDDIRSLLQTVHQSQQLRDDAPLDFSSDFVALRGDGVQLVDEDDRRRVLLGLFEGLTEV